MDREGGRDPSKWSDTVLTTTVAGTHSFICKLSFSLMTTSSVRSVSETNTGTERRCTMKWGGGGGGGRAGQYKLLFGSLFYSFYSFTIVYI